MNATWDALVLGVTGTARFEWSYERMEPDRSDTAAGWRVSSSRSFVDSSSLAAMLQGASLRVRRRSSEPSGAEMAALAGVTTWLRALQTAQPRVGAGRPVATTLGGRPAAPAAMRATGSRDSRSDDRPFIDFQVEKPAMALSHDPTPRFPQALAGSMASGEVMMQFVIDTTGRAEPGTMRVMKATHRLLGEAVQAVFPDMRFAPAEVGGRRVRMLVQQRIVVARDRCAMWGRVGRADRGSPDPEGP
jgi:hypothetical protein